ncbi:MAG: hypothetical protein HAW65_00895 [Alphaproteobacteria bacterium]|nr:hypothetical protein [Alphaproteobacteria bacterium]MBE8219852.1 hypothetical protein [Alphaproteobacteria bacterium]
MAKDLHELASKISDAKAQNSQAGGKKPAASMVGLAYRLMIEVIAGIAVGGFVGWWLDKWFGTSPVLLLVLLFLGLIAGVMSSVRTAAEMRRKLDKE